MLDRTAKLKTYQTYIDGKWIDSASGKTFETCDPYTGQPWALIPECDKVDVDQAVDAASRAFEGGPWPKMTPSARGKIMRRMHSSWSNMPSASVKWKYGTTESARVNELAANTFKKVSLKLGGKSPNIVFDDCILDDAVSGAVSGIFAATGQTCIAGSRLLLQETIHDRFVEKLVDMAKTAW
jgi:acyl-CoA reductase-like NAD-dependent aldehyde dehydrogenase